LIKDFKYLINKLKIMKKVSIGILALIMALVLIGGCIGKYSSPEKTVETMISAMKAGDVDAYLDCLTKESKEWFEAMAKMSPESLTSESLKSQDLGYDPEKLKVTEKKGDRAVMKAEGQPMGLIFKKERGNWKIDIMETMQQMFEGMGELGQ
jgi:ketosteroid isomerase-like protein